MSNIIEHNYPLIAHAILYIVTVAVTTDQSAKRIVGEPGVGIVGDSSTIPKGMVGEFANYPEIVNRRA